MCAANWEQCFVHKGMKLVISIYLNDFNVAGPRHNFHAQDGTS